MDSFLSPVTQESNLFTSPGVEYSMQKKMIAGSMQVIDYNKKYSRDAILVC